MADVLAYYSPTGIASYSQGSLALATAGTVRSFTEWAALLYPGEASRLADDIDNQPTWWTLESAPASGGDGLVLVSPADTTRKTLSEKLVMISGITAAVGNPGGDETYELTVSGSGAGTVTNLYQNTAGTLVIPALGSWTDISYPTTVVTSAGVTKLAGDIQFQFDDAGTYLVTPTVTVESGDAMMRKQVRVMLDTGGGYAQYLTPRYSSNESAYNDENTNEFTVPIVVSATDKIKIQVRTDGGTTAGVLHADANSLSIMRYDPATSGTDSTALHDNGVGEINAITTKATPVGADVMVIEDSAAGFVKKKVLLSALPVQTIATVSTTDATVTTIATIAVPATTTLYIDAIVTARRTGGGGGAAEDGAAYRVQAAYKNVAGTATLIGAGVVTIIGEDQVGWDATLAAATSNALIQVTGAATNNINWSISYTTNAVS